MIRRAKLGQWNLIEAVAPYRGQAQFVADMLVWLAAIYIAASLRFDFDITWSHNDLLLAWVFVGAAQFAFGQAFGLYRQRWHFGSYEEMAAVIMCTIGTTTAVWLMSTVAFSPRLVPNTVIIGGALGALNGMGAVRYVWRLYIDRLRRPSADHATRTIVFGAGEGGMQLINSMMRNPDSPMYAVAALDDDPRKHGLTIKGVKVLGGRDDLETVAANTEAELLIIAIPTGTAPLYQELSNKALKAGLRVEVLPAVDQLLASGQITISDVRPLDIKDLLGRKEIETDLVKISDYISRRRVLVTGAGGSIGSELCRQLHQLAPAQLVMLDRDEGALHGLQLSLDGHAMLDDPNIIVANIRDRERMAEIFATVRPHVVFHAAALKHLPLLENNPDEGFKTNVLGTLNVLEVAAEYGVDHFVNISTDKAADPSSVLGRTKRTAEQLTAWMSHNATGTYLSVRFGNVLGSRGSVLETFQAQIDAGGPVTVTHPEITRFFMTVEEAVQLVIQAGAIGENGEALVLDMGTPVKIDDVARQMIAHADRRIDIKYTGLREGEKLHEVLFGDDEQGETGPHELIMHVDVPPLHPSEISHNVPA